MQRAVKSIFVPFGGQGTELTDGFLEDLRALLEMDLELVIEIGSLAGPFCEGLPPHPRRSPIGLRGRGVHGGLHIHILSFRHLSSSSSAPSSKDSGPEDNQTNLAEK